MNTMRSFNPSAPNFINAASAASAYGDFVSKPKFTETEKFLQSLIDQRDKIKQEERLALQDERQSRLDEQNKQLFDLKIADIDRANKDREALTQFGKGMLQPQVISGIVTDTIAPEQVEKMSFTPEELAQYNAARGDISKLSGSVRTKAELQTKLSNFADTLPSSPEFQESNYQQAQRVASGLEITPGILEELKKYQVADVLAQKENKKDGATYLGEAKELESKIAELKTKQGSILDKQAGVGKEWGKTGSGSGTKMLDSGKMLQYSEMVKNTDSAEELQNMIKEVFINPNIPEKQKESIAANIVLSSGAKLPQGLTDFGKLNVSVEDAQKATTEYLANLQNGVYGNPNGPTLGTPKEIGGLADEIALLEARRNSALAKANSYSNEDRASSARALMGSRLDALLGGNNVIDTSPSSFKEGVLKTETSNMDYSNHRKNAKDETETLGAYQFVPSTLESLKAKTGEKFTKEEFLANPALQDKYFDLLTKSNSEQLKSENLPVNDFNLWLMHNLGGNGQTKNFLSDEPLNEETKKAIRLNLPNGVEPTRENYISQYGNTFAGAPEIKNTPESKDVDIKSLFANVKSTKDKEAASTEINKLAELYKSLGGDRSSAGPIDDIRINAEAINLSKKINVPAEQIIDTIKSQVRQENLINSRNEIISKRMFDTNMNKLINDPKVQTEYDKAWKEEARRRGYIGTSARPFDIEEFIQRTYPEKLIYK